jgi:4-hydroxyacetophenone monooxygenase
VESTVDSAFIRRAVELADLNAVRVALYQQTGDPEIAALPTAINLDPAERELLIDKAAAWLEQHAQPGMPPEPPEAELRALMNLATADEMGDLEFESRRDLPAFKQFPFTTDWPGDKPELPEGFQVAVIGSGFSGLAMGVQLERLGIPYVVLERQPEPGGTWSINRYPDIRVDTISITYDFSFEKEHRWSEYFGRGPEVRAYLDHVSKKYGVYANTRFSRELKRATFDEDRDVWVLEVDSPDGIETIEANVIVNAVGTFANPRFPQFEGIETFDGEILHPARWPSGFDATGKRVAVIGNGSTGVQLLAPIAADAEQVFVFQRTPQWISPRDKYGKAVEPEVLWLIDNFPGYWNWWRYMAIAALFGTHNFLIPDEEWVAQGGKFNPLNDKMRDDLTAYIKAQTGGRQDLIDKLIPDYAPFSRRPVVDNGWYQALTRDNVELVTDGIARFVPGGIETTDGTVYEVDVVVTATGFEVMRYLWPADYLGKGGVNIHDFWSKDGPRAYLGMMTPNFPNMFMLYGPNSQPLSGGTGLPIWYVVWSAYAAKTLVRMIEEGKSRVEVTQEAYDRYNEALDEAASKLLLLQEEGAPEKNYYVNDFGRLQVNAPWYGPEYHRMCTNVDWDDIEIS